VINGCSQRSTPCHRSCKEQGSQNLRSSAKPDRHSSLCRHHRSLSSADQATFSNARPRKNHRRPVESLHPTRLRLPLHLLWNREEGALSSRHLPVATELVEGGSFGHGDLVAPAGFPGGTTWEPYLLYILSHVWKISLICRHLIIGHTMYIRNMTHAYTDLL
jgi:hypothetical protein